MPTVRRRVLRPARASQEDQATARRVAKARQQLPKEQVSLKRWFSKLKRAFTSVEKIQQRIARLEKAVSQSN